jgi:hypothetical protein
MKHFYQSVGGTKLVRRDFGDPNAYHVIAEGLKPKQCEDLQRLLSEGQ